MCGLTAPAMFVNVPVIDGEACSVNAGSDHVSTTLSTSGSIVKQWAGCFVSRDCGEGNPDL